VQRLELRAIHPRPEGAADARLYALSGRLIVVWTTRRSTSAYSLSRLHRIYFDFSDILFFTEKIHIEAMSCVVPEKKESFGIGRHNL